MPLPSRPDLTWLKREARALQRAAAAGDAQKLARVRIYFADVVAGAVQLAQAQTVLAREYGFASWPALAAHVSARADKRKAAKARAQARTEDATKLAGAWLELAKADDLPALLRTMAVGKSRALAAREVMRRNGAGYEVFVAALLSGLASTNARIRFESAHALDTYGNESCRPALVALIDDSVPRVRWMAMHALSCHACGDGTCTDDDAIYQRIAQHALNDESIQVRRHAAVALALAGAANAEATLVHILATQTDPALLRAAKFGLARIKHDANTSPL